jgi:hypothetical protein
MPRFFTLAQAERLLPEVSAAMQEAVSCKTRFEQAQASWQELQQRIHLSGGLLVHHSSAKAVRTEAESAAKRLKELIAGVQELGVLVKDLDIGLIDFPTLFRGQEVYLCWKLGEPRIEFWHGVDESFPGRKPIDRDFLDHHSGDRSH